MAAAELARYASSMKTRAPIALLGLLLVAPCLAGGESTPSSVLEVRHVSVSINRSPESVYRFASDPQNLPKWASGLGGSIKNVGGKWIADGPLGKIEVKFVEKNDLGVLDHDVIPEEGPTMRNPMRVVRNGRGSEVTFTMFRQPGVSAEKFAEDEQWVAKDLRRLKNLLEK
jgi:hypothetical protein